MIDDILQLIDSNFVSQIGDTVIAHREPNPDEARIQAMSVIAACAKGLMYFQSEVCKSYIAYIATQ